MQACGFTGKVACINPSAESVRGHPGYATLGDVPFGLGAAVIAVRADRVPPVLEECVRLSIRSVTIISAGFAEIGPTGRALQDEIAAIAARYDVSVCGPNCLGFFSLHDRTSTFSSAKIPALAGDVAIVSQSGGILNEVLSYGTYRGVRFSKAISSGNEAVLSLADYLEDLLADPHTTTIGAIVEGVRSPDRLRRAFALAARERKPIVALKIGTSALAAASAATHTGAIAGSSDLFAALCAQEGVTLVEDIEELCEALLAFSRARALVARPGAPRGFAAVEISGGGKGLICDLAEHYGLPLTPPSSEQLSNPVDMTHPWENPKSFELHETVLAGFAAEQRYDVVVSRLTVAPQGAIAAALAHGALVNRFRAEHPGMFYAVLGRTSDVINSEWQAFCTETGLTYFQGYRRGIATLGRFHRYRAFLASDAGEPPLAVALPEFARDGELLDEVAAKELLAQIGLPVNRTQFATGPTEAAAVASAIGFPIAVKGISPAASHKSDLGLVALNLRSPDDVIAAAREICAKLPPAPPAVHGRVGLSVQRMVEAGLEVIVGGYRDEVYGPVVLCALGGTFAEAFDERILWIAPVSVADCERAIRVSKIGKLAAGFRSIPSGNITILAQLCSRISAWLARDDRIAELDLNPVILRGETATIVDARVVVRPLSLRRHSAGRRQMSR